MGIVLFLVLFFFAVYGMLQMLAKTLFRARARRGAEPVCVHRVLGVRNCEDVVEGLIRSLVWEDLREELIVLDYGSLDETGKILERLEAEYSFLHVMTPEAYQEYIGQL